MLSRRALMTVAGATMLSGRTAWAQPSPLDEFDAGFADALRNPAALDATRQEREGFADEYDYYLARTLAPRVPPSTRAISDRARALLILFEVTGETRYKAAYRRPVRPGGASGVTIGIGYDVGYAKPAWLEEDWDGLLDARSIDRLKVACGVSGARANALIPSLRDVEIPWKAAERQFRERAVPRWTAVTLTALPNAAELSDHSLGALVSLVYNRGPSFRKTGSRYQHMRAIRLAITTRRFADIPAQIEAMKVLWPANGPVAGLRTRRDLEAKLFRAGLAA